MTRRDFLAYSGSSLAIASLPNVLYAKIATPASNGRTQFFFTEADVPRIIANTRDPLLASMYQEWKDEAPSSIDPAIAALRKSNDIVLDFRLLIEAITRNALIQIVEPTPERAIQIITGIEAILDTEEWDFLGNRKGDIIGMQRCSLATENLLFAREVLWDDLSPEFHNRMLATIADKGCAPCYRTLQDMENWANVDDWIFTPRHADRYDIDMTRWPLILGGNNLRAHPSSSLGIGALALAGVDSRAETWLDAAQESLKKVMSLFNEDGSYFEGISYLDYTLRTTFSFFTAYQRTRGPLPWLEDYPIEQIAEFVVTMTAGRKEDGSVDVVNFSDAKNGVNPSVTSWIAKQTGSTLAQYSSKHYSRPHHYLDFIWYEPKQKATPPPESLKNVRNDLDWIIARSGWEPEDSVLAFRSGGPANHEHADRNTFLFKFNGERLLNDPFNAAYDWRKDGWPLRLTRGHNGLLINGEGSHYHKGEEGTNDSLSFAVITDYQDKGDTVWWTSDATSAYRVVNEHVFRVVRSVYFSKPDIIVVLDQVQFRYLEQPISLRYFPYNADNAATLSTEENRFTIKRPKGLINGICQSNTSVTLEEETLDVSPEETGSYPCVQVNCPNSLSHQIVTVLAAQSTDESKQPKMDLEQDDKLWTARVNNKKIKINTEPREPIFS